MHALRYFHLEVQLVSENPSWLINLRYLDADDAKKLICNPRLNTGSRPGARVVQSRKAFWADVPPPKGEPPNLTLMITCYLSWLVWQSWYLQIGWVSDTRRILLSRNHAPTILQPVLGSDASRQAPSGTRETLHPVWDYVMSLAPISNWKC